MKKMIIILIQYSLIASNWVNYSLGQVAFELFSSSRIITNGSSEKKLWKEMGNLSVAPFDPKMNTIHSKFNTKSKLIDSLQENGHLFFKKIKVAFRKFNNLSSTYLPDEWKDTYPGINNNLEKQRCFLTKIFSYKKVAVNQGTNLQLDLTNSTGKNFQLDFLKFHINNSNAPIMKTINISLIYKHFF